MLSWGNPSLRLCCARLTPLVKWNRGWAGVSKTFELHFSEEMLPEQEEMLPPCEDGQRLEVRRSLLLRGITPCSRGVFTELLTQKCQPRHGAACIWLEYSHLVTVSRHINSLILLLSFLFNLQSLPTTTLLNNVLFTECGQNNVFWWWTGSFFFFPPLTFWSPTTSTIVVFHLDWTKKLDSVKGLFMFLLPHKLSAVPLWIFLFISHKVGHEKLHLKDRTQISGGWRMGCRQGAAGNE